MTPAYLVDTDWVIDHLNGASDRRDVPPPRLKLCSNNRRHFEMVEELEIVSISRPS